MLDGKNRLVFNKTADKCGKGRPFGPPFYQRCKFNHFICNCLPRTSKKWLQSPGKPVSGLICREVCQNSLNVGTCLWHVYPNRWFSGLTSQSDVPTSLKIHILTHPGIRMVECCADADALKSVPTILTTHEKRHVREGRAFGIRG